MAHHLDRHINRHHRVVDGRKAGLVVNLIVIPHIFNQPGLKLACAAQYGLSGDADARMNTADMILPFCQCLQLIFLAGQNVVDPHGQ